MSRVGIQPIGIPPGVEVSVSGSEVTVKGPKGALSQQFHADMSIKKDNGVVIVERPSEERHHKALHGLTRTLLFNMVTGVNEGFTRSLELVGVGYRVQQRGEGISLNVMLSYTVEVDPLPGVELEVVGNNVIHVRGSDKQQVGQMAAMIRKIRPPNVYTGKGIRYLGEQVRQKPGKSARRA